MEVALERGASSGTLVVHYTPGTRLALPLYSEWRNESHRSEGRHDRNYLSLIAGLTESPAS